MPAHWLRKALNPLMERNLVEQDQVENVLSAHQDLGWIQLKNIPGCLPETSILGVIAPNHSLGNQWLRPKLSLAFHLHLCSSAEAADEPVVIGCPWARGRGWLS